MHLKIESHNHPSAIEPYQGAATGVGGIHQDIFDGRPPDRCNEFLEIWNSDTPHMKNLVHGGSERDRQLW